MLYSSRFLEEESQSENIQNFLISDGNFMSIVLALNIVLVLNIGIFFQIWLFSLAIKCLDHSSFI